MKVTIAVSTYFVFDEKVKIIIIWNITLLAFTYPLNVTLTGRETKDSLYWAGSSRSNVSFRHFIILSLKLNSVSYIFHVENTNSNEDKNILCYPELSTESKITHSDDEDRHCHMWYWQVEKRNTFWIELDQVGPMHHSGTLLTWVWSLIPYFFRKYKFQWE